MLHRIVGPLALALTLLIAAFLSLAFRESDSAYRTMENASDEVVFTASRPEDSSLKLTKFKCLTESNRPLSYLEVLRLMEFKEERFLGPFLEILRRGEGFSAYFFETPPTSLSTVATAPFEFVLVEAKSLAGVEPDADTFASHFGGCKDSVASFFNLGRDATLVSPCPSPSASLDPYAHLADFSRTADGEQQRSFWSLVGREMQSRLSRSSDHPLWLSTSGLGVYWLHMRIDTYPKYYTYGVYKKFTLDK